MLLVSNFEIQGSDDGHQWETTYVLQVTNLEDGRHHLNLVCDVSVSPGKQLTRALLEDHFRGAASWRKTKSGGYRGRGHLKIGPGEAASVTLSVTGSAHFRGVTRLELVDRRGGIGREHLPDTGVRVLLDARRDEERSRYSHGYSDKDGLIVGWIPQPDARSSSAITLASGQAENLVEWEGTGFDDLESLARHVRADQDDPLPPPEARAAALVHLIAELSAAEAPQEAIEVINRVLEESEVHLRLGPATQQPPTK